ncbi:MAG TPA: ATP-binding protein [Terriglobia bacterium]|jgi:two-component system phosphate regulon sensor histidine kinase PhoR
MAFRLHSRLVAWNLLLVLVLSFFLAFFLSSAQLALVIIVAVSLTFTFGYGVRIIVARPLRRISVVSRKLAAGHLDQRLPITGDEEIAALGTSLNTMAQTLSGKIQALSDGKQQLELILEAMEQGVMVLDREARITLTNSSLRRVLGTDRDLSRRTTLEVVRRPELDAAVHAVLGTGARRVLEIDAGNNRILQANVAPVTNAGGQVDSVVVVFNDLTDIRRTERMRRDFVANVSHEFKTPLTSIRGYTETLLSGAKDHPKIAVDFLSTIERNARHLETLVSDLLTLARLEAEMPAKREQFELKMLIDEQLATRTKTLQESKIHPSVECEHVQVLADRSRLATALTNLIDNAIHYNKPGGEIRISAEVQAEILRLAVSDTGNGIPSEELPRIFERFYRVDKARSRESGGTGLGLSIVKHAIESQGGSITVTSRLGAGSTFTIHLPV